MFKGIAFVGRKLSGKDTAINFISNILTVEKNISVYNFADPVKQIAMDILGLSFYDCYTQEGKAAFNSVYGITNRAILEGIGNGLRMSIVPDLWVRVLKNKLQKETQFWLIADGRFPNEVETVHELGGISVLINRDSVKPVNTDNEPISESSVAQCQCTHIINNNGSISDFYKTLYNVLLKGRFSDYGMLCSESICINNAIDKLYTSSTDKSKEMIAVLRSIL